MEYGLTQTGFFAKDVQTIYNEIFDEIEKISNDLSSSHKMELTKFNPEIFSKIGEYFSNKHNFQKSIDYYLKCLEAKNDDLIRVKLSELYGKINQNENISNLTIKDIEMLWIMQEAIENKSLFDFFADIN